MTFSLSSIKLRYVTYPPPVDKRALRREVDELNIPAAAADLALSEMPPLEETRPTAIESGINTLFDQAQASAEQKTLERIEQVSGEADLLTLGGDEANFKVPVDTLDGNLARLAADARLNLPPFAREKVGAALQLRAFLQSNQIAGDPTFHPSKIRWLAIGVVVTILEAFVTAWLYAPALGDRESLITALLIGASVTVAALIIGWGILLARYKRNSVARLSAPFIIAGGTLVFLFVAMCAAHFRLIVGGDQSLETVSAIAFSTVQIALSVAESLWSRPSLPLTDPQNLGFILLNGAAMSAFSVETARTWVHFGFRDVASRAYKADRLFQREARAVASDMTDAGADAKRDILRQSQELTRRDRVSRALRNRIMTILSAHATAMTTISGERQRALAILLDAYRRVVAKGRRINPGFALPRSPSFRSDITLPSGFDEKLRELQAQIFNVIGQRAQAQALVDAKVSGAITAFAQFLSNMLANAEGIEHVRDTPKDPDQ